MLGDVRGIELTISILSKRLTLRLSLEAISQSLMAGIVMGVIVLAVQIPFYDKFDFRSTLMQERSSI